MLLSVPQNRAREKKQLVMYSHSQARHKKALISPRGPAIMRASTKKNIFVPLFAIAFQFTIYVVDELEKGRLRRLLAASICLYFLAVLAAFALRPIVGDLSRVDIFLRFPWFVYFLVFISYCWMPVSVWTFWQGFTLRRKTQDFDDSKDLSIPNLAIAIPIFMWFIYFFTRAYYK